MQRLAIGIDLDETLNNMIEKLLIEYNEKYFDNVKYADIIDWDINLFLKRECARPFQEFCSYSFMVGLDVVEGTVETLTELSEHHDIYFVTAAFPETIHARDRWLAQHFPFYNSRMLITCVQKQLLKLDVLVDDYEENLIGGDYLGFLIDKPWNRKFEESFTDGIHRIKSINELLPLIGGMHQK